MPEPADPVQLSPKPRKSWLPRPRFSLRSLVLLALLAGSAGLFYAHIDSWFVCRVMPCLPNQQGGLVSPDGRYFALSAWRDVDPPDSHQLRVWNIASGAEVYTHDYGATEHEWGTSFLPASGYLLQYENGEHIVDLYTGKAISQAFNRVCFCGEKALLFSNEIDSEDAELWDLAARKCIKRLKVPSQLEQVKLDHTLTRILFTKLDKGETLKKQTSMIWDLERGALTHSVPGRVGFGQGFSANDRFVLTYEHPLHTEASTYFVSESATGQLKYSFASQDNPEFSPDGSLLLQGGSTENESILLNLENGSELQLKGRPVWHHEGIHDSFSCFSQDGHQVFTSTVPRSAHGDKGSVLLAWDCTSGENLFTVAEPEYETVKVFPDIHRVVAGGCLFATDKREIVARSDGEMASDHRRLLVSGYAYNDKRKSPVLLDAVTGQTLFQFPLSASGNLCEMDTACAYILTNGSDKSTLLWHRRRPEYGWGIAWLPEFWVTVGFAVALVWSMWRDRRKLGRSD